MLADNSLPEAVRPHPTQVGSQGWGVGELLALPTHPHAPERTAGLLVWSGKQSAPDTGLAKIISPLGQGGNQGPDPLGHNLVPGLHCRSAASYSALMTKAQLSP